MSSPGADESTTTQQSDVSDEHKSGVQVHSANSWETADLGDKQRNEKFLRLMGASKKEHHGKIVIGEKLTAHARDRVAEAHQQEELEEQFSQGMEHRLAGGRRGHLGLGFHPDEKGEAGGGGGGAHTEQGDAVSTEKQQADAGHTQTERQLEDEARENCEEREEKDEKKREARGDCEKAKETDERKRESFDKDGHHEAKKMKFVKSSS